MARFGERLKQAWRELEKEQPGRRFTARRRRRQQVEQRQSRLRRMASLGLGLFCLAIGVVLVFIPGPAVVFFGLGPALLADHSMLVARGLDRAELQLRAAGRWLRSGWRRLHQRARPAKAR